MSVAISAPPGVLDATAQKSGGTWWLVGGVAAELSDRLQASVAFIRLLLFVGMWVVPDAFWLYAMAALLVPHAGRRAPGWSNLIALSRVGLLYLVVWAGAALVNEGGVFSDGPAVWLPTAGTALLVIAVLLTSGRPSPVRDAQRDRSVVLAILAALAGLGLLAGAIELVPSVRWESGVGVLAVLGGAALALGGTRAHALIVPVTLLAAFAVLLASAGVRLQGGLGDRSVRLLAVTSSHSTYRRAIGTLHLDLSAMHPHQGLVTITASVGIGDLEIRLPSDAATQTSLHLGRGTFEALTCNRELKPGTFMPHYGEDQSRAVSTAPTQTACGAPLRHPALRLRIIASVGVGRLVVVESPWQASGTG